MSKKKDFKEQHPELFGVFAEHQEHQEHISNWDGMFRQPKKGSPKKAFEVQEALTVYPHDDIHKKVLEMYYYENLPLSEIKRRIGSKHKQIRSKIHKAKVVVLTYYKEVYLKPVEIIKVLKTKQIAYGDMVGRVKQVLDTNGEIYWTSDSLIRLDGDVQDLLDFDKNYADWDYTTAGNDTDYEDLYEDWETV